MPTQPLLHIHCTGKPYDIGYHHGSEARGLIARALVFYADYFLAKSKLDWTATKAAAERFIPFLDRQCPHLVEEMRGVAAGAGVTFPDILALNVRTEIAMGLFNDGCSSLYCKRLAGRDDLGILAQNWDWEVTQSQNLIALHITPENGGPAMAFITEAGIIGKIGFNSVGVGICLNAIRAKGVDYNRLPVHLAMRSVLECPSQKEALAMLLRIGVAASCHLIVGGPQTATSLECSFADILPLQLTDGLYTHTNHWLLEHTGPDGPISEAVFLKDSNNRLDRLNSLFEKEKRTTGKSDKVAAVEQILEDEDQFPDSINKSASPESGVATLFSIVMDLGNKVAKVRIGRPTEPVDTFELRA